MTSEPRDRLLEYALGRVLAEDSPAGRSTPAEAPRGAAGGAPDSALAVDLTEQILEAWERGDRGSTTVEELEREVRAPAPRPLRSPAPARVSWRIAASLLVGVGLGATWWQLRDPGPSSGGSLAPLGPVTVARVEPFAEATGPLLALDDPAAAPSLLPAPGVRLTVPGAEPVSIAFAGGQLELSPGSIFTLNAGEPALQLEFGGLRASGFAQPFSADFGFGRARLRPGSSLVLRLEPDELRFLDLPAAKRPAAARVALLDEGQLRQRLELDVRAGEATLAFGDEKRLLREPDAYVLLSPPSGTDSAALLDREWLVEILAAVGERESMNYGPRSKVLGRNLAPSLASEADVELDAFLEDSPGGWTLLQGLLIASTFEVPDRSGNLLGFLARSSSPRALRVAQSLWTHTPESFTEDHLIAFAGAGGATFAHEVRARVVVGLEYPSPELPTLKSAAHLARESDDTGRVVLRDALPSSGAAPDSERSLEDQYVAARGLELLGDSAPWQEFADRWARKALEDLDAVDAVGPAPARAAVPGRRARWIASVLALHREPAANLPNWRTRALWEAAVDDWDGGPEALRSELEAQLLR